MYYQDANCSFIHALREYFAPKECAKQASSKGNMAQQLRNLLRTDQVVKLLNGDTSDFPEEMENTPWKQPAVKMWMSILDLFEGKGKSGANSFYATMRSTVASVHPQKKAPADFATAKLELEALYATLKVLKGYSLAAIPPRLWYVCGYLALVKLCSARMSKSTTIVSPTRSAACIISRALPKQKLQTWPQHETRLHHLQLLLSSQINRHLMMRMPSSRMTLRRHQRRTQRLWDPRFGHALDQLQWPLSLILISFQKLQTPLWRISPHDVSSRSTCQLRAFMTMPGE